MTVSRFLPMLALLTACATTLPPTPSPAPVPAAEVSASFGKTWDAVIDFFANNNISIRTMDRASGFIAAEPVSVQQGPGGGKPHPLADCGKVMGMPLYPETATYNIVVRGDSARSTVKPSIRYIITFEQNNSVTECTSTGVWERNMEATVKTNAEGKAP